MRYRAVLVVTLMAVFAAFVGCQRAGRYPASVSAKPNREEKSEPLHPHWTWHLQEGWREPTGTPIVFIPQGHAEWDQLPSFWNDFPSPAAGPPTAILGQSALGAASAAVLADRLVDSTKSVKIKVPLGLPDPTPHVPSANPPTREKWELGRKIFFDKKLRAGVDRFACASCHQPAFGFAEDRAVPINGSVNTPSLVNRVYHRHQFWDGRVGALEEVLVRSLADEGTAKEKKPTRLPQETHRWGGLVEALGRDVDYQLHFQQVFDLKQPTQDAIAKSLATYLRTIFSGGSIYDRAEQERRRRKAPELLAEHFAPFLDEPVMQALRTERDTKEGLAKKLEQGRRLFVAKGCAVCHPSPLFTDGDFHNLGIGDSALVRKSGEETGRFAAVPIGLKEPRLVGAFKTPTLRNLMRTAPYYHDGSATDLRFVIKYLNLGVSGYRYYLPPHLLDAGGHGKRLDMSFDDEAALVIFLRALDGAPVDARVATAPKE